MNADKHHTHDLPTWTVRVIAVIALRRRIKRVPFAE